MLLQLVQLCESRLTFDFEADRLDEFFRGIDSTIRVLNILDLSFCDICSSAGLRN